MLCYENGKFVVVDVVVLFIQYDEGVKLVDLCEVIMEELIKNVFLVEWLYKDIQFYINLIGQFIIGGLVGDCGLIGCKIIVDIYGGVVCYGGGVFFGKDLFKVDCFVVYVGCYVVKNIVVVGLVDKCEIQVFYVIGVVELMLIFINIFGINKVSEE